VKKRALLFKFVVDFRAERSETLITAEGRLTLNYLKKTPKNKKIQKKTTNKIGRIIASRQPKFA
jgi:hypothetical protein